MKKRILFIGYNYKPEPTGIGKYTGEMVDWLAKEGHDCSVITTYPYYPYWKVQEPFNKNKFWYKKSIENFASGGKLSVYRCPMYVPKTPTGLKRMLLDVSFFGSATLQLSRLLGGKKFDYVMCIAPSFQIGLLGVFYKKMKASKLIYHIQDLQIEAARDFNMIKSEKGLNMMFRLERYIFKKADVVSSISEGMNAKIEEKAKKPVFMLPNWTDTKFFRPLSNPDKLKCDFGFQPEDKIVLYSGAIGEKQGLEAILYAAAELKQQTEIKFIICGTGPYKEKLEMACKTRELQNVYFFPLQPMEKFNDFLNMADVHLVIQKNKASDLVMPSKLTTILGVGGLSLITANEGTGLHNLVSKNKMGLLVDAEDEQALLQGIKNALSYTRNSELHQNARNYALRYLSIDGVMKNFEKEVLV